MASKTTETILLKIEKDTKSDNLESEKETLGRESIQNGSVTKNCLPGDKSSKGKPKPPVPPKRSTLTYGKNYVSVNATSPSTASSSETPSPLPSNEPSKEPDHPLTSHLVSVKTNILCATPKVLPTPKNKNQPVLSTFLPALPPKSSRTSNASSPNLPKNQNFDPQSVPPQKPQDTEAPSPNESLKEKSNDEESKSSSAVASDEEKEPGSNKNGVEKSWKESDSTVGSPEFSPSQSPPELPRPPPKPVRRTASTPPKAEGENRDRDTVTGSKNVTFESDDKSSVAGSEKESKPKDVAETKEQSNASSDTVPEEPFCSEQGNENTNTIKRAPPSYFDQKNRSDFGTKIRTKSPIRVSFADEDRPASRAEEKLSKTKRATKELKSIIHQIEYSESDYCSDDNCRTCTVRKTSSLSRRRSVSPKSSLAKSSDLIEGYASCCEDGTKIVTKKTKNILKRNPEKNVQTYVNRTLCNCPYDNFVIDNRVPLSRPNSSIGDYCTQSNRSKSVAFAKKNSGSGIKTPFWNGSSRYDYESPGLGLIVTISSDGIDKEPKRTVQFISGGPAINFGLGGTLGRYTKSKSQDKSLKIASNGFHSDRSASDFEGPSERPNHSSVKSNVDRERLKIYQTVEKSDQENAKDQNRQKRVQGEVKKLFALSEKQKNSEEVKYGQSENRNDNFRSTYVSVNLNGNKSPGEVLEHFGKLATSVTTSEISKLSNGLRERERETPISVKAQIKNLEKFSSGKNQSHSFENYRTVPPTSFNNPDPYLGSAFVQYVRETLPHQPNSLPGNSTGSAFDKYIRHGSGRFDKSLILPQQPKSDKPSAFERLCGDKIYSSRRGIYGKRSAQNQNVSGSLDCVWGKTKPSDLPKKDFDETSQPTDSRPSSCTYEINQPRSGYRNPATGSGGHPNYAVVTPVYQEKEKTSHAIARTSKKGIIEPETSTGPSPSPHQTVTLKVCSPQTIRANSPQYFNPRSLENYKLAPGFKTDLSTLYSGVFYMNNESDGASSKSINSLQILNEYGIRCNPFGTLNRNKLESISDSSNQDTDSMGTSNSTGRGSGEEQPGNRKILTAGFSSMVTTCRIPEEPPPGLVVTYPPQYHPSEEELLQGDNKVRSNSRWFGFYPYL